MHSIQIDEEVFAQLSRNAVGFNVSPNDVLRRILKLSITGSSDPTGKSPRDNHETTADTLLDFVRSPRFQQSHQAVDRFLSILGWLHRRDAERFADIALSFHRGSRRYFGKSKGEVEQSGEGITAKPIPQSPFWVLTTLDNKSKRMIVEDVLRALDHPRNDINLILAELPDSNIRRRRQAILDTL